MAKQRQPHGPPMTLGNMRRLGVQRLFAVYSLVATPLTGEPLAQGCRGCDGLHFKPELRGGSTAQNVGKRSKVDDGKTAPPRQCRAATLTAKTIVQKPYSPPSTQAVALSSDGVIPIRNSTAATVKVNRNIATRTRPALATHHPPCGCDSSFVLVLISTFPSSPK